MIVGFMEERQGANALWRGHRGIVIRRAGVQSQEGIPHKDDVWMGLGRGSEPEP